MDRGHADTGDAPVGWAAAEEAAALVLLDAGGDTGAAGLPDEVTVTGRDGHHLQRVRRLRRGERVVGADGRGRWRLYEVTGEQPGGLLLGAAGSVRHEPEPAPALGVAVALTKGGALDGVVAGLTELGVARIEPFRSSRSVVRWDAERARRALGRWRAIAREAAMQSRRARLPEIRPLTELRDFAGRAGLVVADRPGGPVGALPGAPPEGRTVVVGPEGGFGPEELAALGSVPRLAVGPHVLRAETAPIAVAAVLMARTVGGAQSMDEL